MLTRFHILVVAVVAVSAALAWQASSFWTGDYPAEAGPVVDSLIHGQLGDFLAGRPLMGPLSLLLRLWVEAYARSLYDHNPVNPRR